MRQSGYYWVRPENSPHQWVIGLWEQEDGGYWYLPGYECIFYDSSMLEIDEIRIEEPNR